MRLFDARMTKAAHGCKRPTRDSGADQIDQRPKHLVLPIDRGGKQGTSAGPRGRAGGVMLPQRRLVWPPRAPWPRQPCPPKPKVYPYGAP